MISDVGTFLRWVEAEGGIDHTPGFPFVSERRRYGPEIPTEEAVELVLSATPDDVAGSALVEVLRPQSN